MYLLIFCLMFISYSIGDFVGFVEGVTKAVEKYEKKNAKDKRKNYLFKVHKKLFMRVDECDKLKKEFKDEGNHMSISQKKSCKQAKKKLKELFGRVLNSED